MIQKKENNAERNQRALTGYIKIKPDYQQYR